jgi:hypothetical protein
MPSSQTFSSNYQDVQSIEYEVVEIYSIYWGVRNADKILVGETWREKTTWER